MPTIDVKGHLIDFPENLSPDELNKAVGSAADQLPDTVTPEGKSLLRRAAESVVKSSTLPIAGGVIGGLLGAELGPGAIGTATIGGAAGESYRQMAARSLGIDAPATSMEAAKKIGEEGVVQGAGEALGSFVLNPAAKAVGRLVKKPAGDLFQIITKIKPEDAATLFKNPKAVLPSAWTKAQNAWKEAATKAGIDINDASPAIINALKTDAKNTVFSTFERLGNGDGVTAGQIQTAKQALDIALMPAAKTERNRPLVALYGKIRSTFTDALGKESPELAAANKQYAVAKAGSRFRSIFPRNLDNSPAYFRSTVLPTFVFGTGAYNGEPGSGAMKALATVGATSPLAIGSAIATLGATRRIVPRAITGTIAQMANDYLKRKENVSAKRALD